MSPRDRAYPPGSWSVERVREALTATKGTSPVPSIEDAASWDAIAAESPTDDYVADLVAEAERLRDESVPPLPATLFADYERTGDRARYEDVYFDRCRRLSVLAVAECVECDGRYLDAILDHAWEICEQSTWLLPAHLPAEQRRGGLPVERPPDEHHLALFSARTGFMLAELDHLLGERLNPALRRRIRAAVDERVLCPFESDEHFHWRESPVGNWNAVCNVSAAIAGLYLETDRDRLAALLVRAIESLRDYVASFGSDGCTPEGLGYWNFGVGHYAMLADALAARTDGALSLCTPPILSEVARYPLRISLSPGRHLPFSDSREPTEVSAYAAAWAGDRFNLPALGARGRDVITTRDGLWDERISDVLMELVRDLCWAQRAPDRAPDRSPGHREYFADCEWWIARAAPDDPDGLVIGAKAGHNDEPHNHNDCGSFVVHYRGESSATDPGFGVYDRNYFSERRYEYFTARSLGHSVPYVNGCEQSAGAEYGAHVLDRTSGPDVERFVVDLADCYPTAAGVTSLRRGFELDRRAGRVTVADDVTFVDGTAESTFASILISYAPTERTGDGVTIRGDRTETSVAPIDCDVRFEVERLTDAVEVTRTDQFDVDARDVWRTKIEPTGGIDGSTTSVALSFEPDERS